MATGSRLVGPGDDFWMAQTLELARRGEGRVEPNPLVGCVIVRDGQAIAEGAHLEFGGPHAEIHALRSCAAELTRGATLFVNLEPCCHFGKTPPCTDAIVNSGIARVVVANEDPFPEVSGLGLQQLRAKGIEVSTGCLAEAARQLNAPYFHRLVTGMPWVLAKWAMTLDGRMATDNGESRWISNHASRQRVHALRGRMDAIIVGRGTVEYDHPQLTARPPGSRVPLRIVLASSGTIPSDEPILATARDVPTMVVVDPRFCDKANRQRLSQAGAEVHDVEDLHAPDGLIRLLLELGHRKMTNVMVEGGPRVLASFQAANAIHEIHLFVAPKIVGGERLMSPILGSGVLRIADAVPFRTIHQENLDGDLYWQLRRV